MKAEILCVGTELLLGDIINTNASYLAKELALLGIDCYYQTVVGDNPQRLKESLEIAFSRADMVITSGGLGPTYDDLTKETMAEYFELPMEFHEPSNEMLERIFEKLDRPITENNRKQAFMPKGAIVFENDRGTANGLAIEGGGKIAIMLPGPPVELTALFQRKVRPYLEAKSNTTLVSRNIHFYGIGEAQLEDELHDYMLEHTNPTVAPYAKQGEVRLRVTASAPTEEEAIALLNPTVEELCKRYEGVVYSVGTDLPTTLVEALQQEGKTIATAESCTGGMVSKMITEVSGSSDVFSLGMCTYSNEMKQRYLGVRGETLEQHGAVSEETALEMARGIREVAGADYGISTTGIAGPTGGTEEKPVGLVYIAISHAEGERVIKLNLNRNYGGSREHIRYSATLYLLNLALRTVQPTYIFKP